jgi:formyltetrahydrofolate synthetase
MKEDAIKIMLLFKRKPLAKFFMTDTYETLHVYIMSNKYSTEGDTKFLENPKNFFVRVQMNGSHGFMDDNSIQ